VSRASYYKEKSPKRKARPPKRIRINESLIQDCPVCDLCRFIFVWFGEGQIVVVDDGDY
jgi:hypothetical protein